MKTVFPNLCLRALAVALVFAFLVVGVSVAMAALGGASAPASTTAAAPSDRTMGSGAPLLGAIGLLFLGAGVVLRALVRTDDGWRPDSGSNPGTNGKVFRIDEGRAEAGSTATQ